MVSLPALELRRLTADDATFELVAVWFPMKPTEILRHPRRIPSRPIVPPNHPSGTYLKVIASYANFTARVISEQSVRDNNIHADEKLIADLKALALECLNTEIRHAWEEMQQLVRLPLEPATETAPYVEGDLVAFVHDLTAQDLGLSSDDPDDVIIRQNAQATVVTRQQHLIDNHLYGRVAVRLTGESGEPRTLIVQTSALRPVFTRFRRTPGA